MAMVWMDKGWWWECGVCTRVSRSLNVVDPIIGKVIWLGPIGVVRF